MKIIRFKINSSLHLNGMFDGLEITFRDKTDLEGFNPFCLIGPNGSGKSQFLEILSESFQSLIHHCLPREERFSSNSHSSFELDYAIANSDHTYTYVRAEQAYSTNNKLMIKFSILEDTWQEVDVNFIVSRDLLPSKIVGYTSGANETLSIPYLNSRAEYADEVGKEALNNSFSTDAIPDTRLMLVDYSTHLELLISNLLLGTQSQKKHLLDIIGLHSLYSFRCVVQLAHQPAPKIKKMSNTGKIRSGVHLTKELSDYIQFLKSCCTCFSYDSKTESYIFDFKVDIELEKAFKHYWKESLDLYSSFHKLYMLNDLIIPKRTRERYKNTTMSRSFVNKLPEPQDEDKVFRFEEVKFLSKQSNNKLDYITLSDGEHQFSQILGVFSIFHRSNLLFILDEPESHFNPQWRTKLISRIKETPTNSGNRINSVKISQECFITTHSPFVPSDLSREKVLIFKRVDNKIRVARPEIETYGSNFDAILKECFDVNPPISQLPQKEIDRLMNSNDIDEIKNSLGKFGDSVEKTYLIDRIWELSEE